jgi:PAS domain S-box-containing protein
MRPGREEDDLPSDDLMPSSHRPNLRPAPEPERPDQSELILRAVVFVADELLRGASWETLADEALGRLGEATSASRVYVYQNETAPNGELLMTEVVEWDAPGVISWLDDPEHKRYPYAKGYERWRQILSEGGTIHGNADEFPESERADLASEDIASTVAVPIFTSGGWWGYMGLEDSKERTWSGTEIEALRAAASIVGAAIDRVTVESDRARAEEARVRAEAEYRTLLEQIPVIVYTDMVEDPAATDYTTRYISPQVETILGYTPKEWESQPDLWRRILHPQDTEHMLRIDGESNRGGGPFSAEYRVIARDGRTVWLRDEAVMLRGPDGTQYWHGVMQDITAQKLVADALRKALGREQEAIERLRTVDQMKDTFLAAVSHDLRTPLAAILGLSLTLENAADGLSADERNELLGRLARNARKMDRLLKDLLDLDRIERGVFALHPAPVDLGAVAEAVVAELDLRATNPVEVEADMGTVNVDGAKVERIIENLLINAARHTPPGTRIWVRVERIPDAIELVVEDAGPGVPEELRESVFEPFRQAGGNPSPGAGIGLSLVARFAELHGGRASVQQRPGGGASFRVVIPI